MEFVEKPPKWLTDALPESARDLLEGAGWWVVLGFVGVVVLLLVWAILGQLGRAVFGRRPPAPVPKVNLEERLAELPPPPPGAVSRGLTYEGIAVRLRLVVVAPAGKDEVIPSAAVLPLLDRVVPGLSAVAAQDQAHSRLWPPQVSSEGFRIAFHRNTPLPEGDGNPSHWIAVAGRARVGNQQLLLGLVLWTREVTTLPRRTLQPHQWAEALRIKPHVD